METTSMQLPPLMGQTPLLAPIALSKDCHRCGSRLTPRSLEVFRAACHQSQCCTDTLLPYPASLCRPTAVQRRKSQLWRRS